MPDNAAAVAKRTGIHIEPQFGQLMRASPRNARHSTKPGEWYGMRHAVNYRSAAQKTKAPYSGCPCLVCIVFDCGRAMERPILLSGSPCNGISTLRGRPRILGRRLQINYIALHLQRRRNHIRISADDHDIRAVLRADVDLARGVGISGRDRPRIWAPRCPAESSFATVKLVRFTIVTEPLSCMWRSCCRCRECPH